MATYLKRLAFGTVVHVDAATNRVLGPATLIPGGCPEFFMVRSDNPEPSCEADCWTEATCDAPMFETHGNPNGRICMKGHVYRGIEVEWAIDGAVEQVERTLGRDLPAADVAYLRDLVAP